MALTLNGGDIDRLGARRPKRRRGCRGAEQAVSKHYSPSYLLQHKLLDFVVLRPTGFVFLLLELRPAVNS